MLRRILVSAAALRACLCQRSRVRQAAEHSPCLWQVHQVRLRRRLRGVDCARLSALRADAHQRRDIGRQASRKTIELMVSDQLGARGKGAYHQSHPQ